MPVATDNYTNDNMEHLKMKRSINLTVSLVMIFMSVVLVACSSSSQLPTHAERALQAYWQSLPSYPTISHQILYAWRGTVPADRPNMEVWCVETEITVAEDPSVIGEKITWIVVRNDEDADWTAMMLAAMSSIWPYEACGEGK